MTKKSHTGAEQDIFPHLAKRKPAIIAYTATRWRGLLKCPKDWSGPVMTASDCYRFGIEEKNRSMASRLIRDAARDPRHCAI